MKSPNPGDSYYAARLAEVGQNFSVLLHELCQPLSGIELALKLALRQTVETDLGESLQDALSEVQRLVEMVDQTRSFLIPRQTAREDFLLEPVVHRVLRLVERSLKKGKIQLVTEIDPLPPVDATISSVEQIIYNLLNNARDALQERGAGGRLLVKVRAHEAWAEVIIADDGLGILAENAETIWQPYFSTKGQRGSGLGLPIAKKIAESLGGRLTVIDDDEKARLSEPPPVTAFSLLLPLATTNSIGGDDPP